MVAIVSSTRCLVCGRSLPVEPLAPENANAPCAHVKSSGDNCSIGRLRKTYIMPHDVMTNDSCWDLGDESDSDVHP